MNQSISRFLGRLAKRFGGEEDQEISLRKPELKEIEQESIPNLEPKKNPSSLNKKNKLRNNLKKKKNRGAKNQEMGIS